MAAEIDVWRFKTQQPGRWVWQHVSGGGDVLMQSDLAFPTIETCAVDAQRCGYHGVIADYAASD